MIENRNKSLSNFFFSLEVSCFGAGPGSEVLGLHPFLPNNTQYHLFDNCTFWEHNAKYLLGKGLGAEFDFNFFDAQKKLKRDQIEIIKRVNVIVSPFFLLHRVQLSDAVLLKSLKV